MKEITERRLLNRLLDEHDHIRKMLNLLEIQFLDLCRDRGPDFTLMRSIVVYVQEYPEQAHHPLEDAIFSILRKRVKKDKLLQKLMVEHTELEEITRNLRESIESLDHGDAVTKEIMTQLQEFLQRQRRHLHYEEMEVLPLVRKALTESDWEHIESLVPPIDDPVFAERTRQDYEFLYQKIEK